MDRKNSKISGGGVQPFSDHKSYSIVEIMAAGGATAFANKMGKNPKSIEDRLKAFPKDAFLTEEEATDALKILNESK
jgi:hypothetical protein